MADLISIRGRLEVYLMDVGSLVWDADTLDEAIRQALRDLQMVSGNTLTIEGLDGASATVLDADMEGLLVRGAAGYAVEMRTIDRADAFELSQTGIEMGNWATKQKAQFWTEVERLRLRSLQRSSNAPYFTLPDPDFNDTEV